jgi:coatomer protein complex subunit gamma
MIHFAPLLTTYLRRTKTPARFIRYIFNRVILEQPRVRAAAVSSLAKFASTVPTLTDSILALMQRCLIDNDDEVRDRAVYFTELFINDRESVDAALHKSELSFWICFLLK